MKRSAVLLVLSLLLPAASRAFSYDDYGAVLQERVDARGRVDYAGLVGDRGRLDAFARSLAALAPSSYDAWDEPSQIAFWINAYNALTLVLIVDHYPIRPPHPERSGYPANSIRQIPGAWDRIEFEVMGKPITLDTIENRMLRARFDEPRIHMALVCAAVSCPPLRREPYVGERLDEQLDDQSRRFLENRANFQLDEAAGVVRLSPIFRWFAGDFVARYGEHGAVMRFIAEHVDDATRRKLRERRYELQYFDYDWTLNEQGK